MTEELNDNLNVEKNDSKQSLVGNWMIYGFIAGLLVFAMTQKIVWVGLGMCLGILLAAVKEMQDNRKTNKSK